MFQRADGISSSSNKEVCRAYKKLQDNIVADVNSVVELIVKDPSIGVKKKGDLRDLFVYKFRSQNQLYLLGYSVQETIELVTLEAIGPHENFYRDLKN